MSDLSIFSALGKSDIEECLQIEEKEFQYPWSYTDFMKCIYDHSNICLRHGKTNEIIGYLFYIVGDNGGAEIINLVISNKYKRKKLGSKLLKFVLNNKKYPEVSMTVRETNLAGQLFLRHNGMKCVEILHKVYDDTDEPGYYFINSKGVKNDKASSSDVAIGSDSS